MRPAEPAALRGTRPRASRDSRSQNSAHAPGTPCHTTQHRTLWVTCAARDDVAVITANPKTAGVARWIFLALWGAKLSKGKKAATKYVTKVRP